MSHYMTALAMKQKGLKPAAKIVLYWLADHHNGETGQCFPSLKKLAEECEMNRSTIVRHLEALEEAGLIERVRRTRDNGSQTSTAYILHLTPVAERNSPCCKTQQPPVAKCDPHNLGNINLGNEPITDTNVSLCKKAPDQFDDFWAAYPRKVGKAEAKKAYAKAMKKVGHDDLMFGLSQQLPAMLSKEQRYRPHAATWLNKERWADEPEAPTGGQRGVSQVDEMRERSLRLAQVPQQGNEGFDL